jgi:pyrimidine 5'-nucleotidase
LAHQQQRFDLCFLTFIIAYLLSRSTMDILLFAATASVGYRNILAKREKSSFLDDSLRQSLEAGTSLNAKEVICTVTPANVPLSGGGLRADMRLHNLWHRATYVLVKHVPPHLYQYPGIDPADLSSTFVLVQKRSVQKDYCPNKLDPTPGGVVGYGESYEDNAVREIKEEMNIDVKISTSDGGGGAAAADDSDGNGATSASNTLQRLFTFPYEDDKVRVWGDFYECTYHGPLKDLVMQEEEVQSVHRMSLQEMKDMIRDHPENFMPDACHAMRLYFQRKEDMVVQRKLLKGYSSGSLEAYGLRPKPRVVFFDCDDCLYFDGWTVAKQLTAKIDHWCVNHGLQPGQAYELYKQYGTALRGLLAEGYLEESEEAIDGFLKEVHDIPVHDLLSRDEELRSMLLAMDPSIPKYIFTASVSHHAIRCIQTLGIEDLFVDVIDCKKCNFETKHSKHSFDVAMRIAGVEDPESCLFLDDSLTNIRAARNVGWRSVLVGRVGRDHGKPIESEHAELEIDRIHEFRSVLPELFQTSS